MARVNELFWMLAPRTMLWVNASTVAAAEVAPCSWPVAKAPWLMSPTVTPPVSVAPLWLTDEPSEFQTCSRVVRNQAVDLVERDGGIGAAGSESLRNVLRHVEGRGVAQIADQRRDARIDADVDTNRVGAVIDVVVEVAVEVAVGVEVAVAVQIAVAVAVQIAVQIGGNLRLGLTLALEAQLALAFALALTLILILIVRIPEIGIPIT